jgi:RNA polymerase subunit RPABC4/transcription elongation factor Spt4
MHCRNCGSEIHPKAIACPKCGLPPLTEKKFCQECGESTNENQIICLKCGVKLLTKGKWF